MASNSDSTAWDVELHDAFVPEYNAMDAEQRMALLAAANALKARGPAAGRPLVGTLDNPKHPNIIRT